MTTDLEALRALDEAATAGPWSAKPEPVDDHNIDILDDDDGVLATVYPVLEVVGRERLDTVPARANAALIAAMRNALPRLLAIAEAAERAREALGSIMEGTAATWVQDAAATAHASLTAVLGEKP